MHILGDIFDRMIDVDRQRVQRVLPHKGACGESTKYASLEVVQWISDKYKDKIDEWMMSTSDLHPTQRFVVAKRADTVSMIGVRSYRNGMRNTTAGVPCIDVSKMNRNANKDGGAALPQHRHVFGCGECNAGRFHFL